MKNYFILIVFIVLCARLLVSLFVPIVGDEAYYWVWGKHLQLSYFDHPGMVAWMSSLSNHIPYLTAATSLRLVFLVLSLISFSVWFKVYLFQTEKADLQSQLLFTFFFLLNPLTGFGSLLVTPDAPLILFWGLSYFSILKILKHQKTSDYILLGVFLGLGFCSKYHIVLLPLGLVLSLAFKKQLKSINFKKLLLTVVSGFIFCLPVLIWNYQNDFASFKFQLNHGFKGKTDFEIWWSTTYIYGQLLLFNPFLMYEVFRINFKKSSSSIALFQWFFFLYSSLKAKVEANWPTTSHASGLTSLDYKNIKFKKLAIGYSSIILFAIAVLLLFPKLQKKALNQPSELMVFDILSETQNYRPLYGPTYQLSSLMSLFSNQEEFFKLRDLSRHDFYDSLDQSLPIAKVFYVLKYDDTFWPEYILKKHIKKIKTLTKYELSLYEISNE